MQQSREAESERREKEGKRRVDWREGKMEGYTLIERPPR